MSKRCFGCMKLKESSPICEHCGYNENVPNYPHQLPVGTVLRGQYTVGKVLGQGGFGITYIGWDQSLEATVAIKEFYPSGIVNRDSHYTQALFCNGEDAQQHFAQRKDRFLLEAKMLAKLQNIPGVVRVQNMFSENNTVYIVMEYVKGIDLKHYIRMQNRPLTVKETFFFIAPVIRSMARVHQADLVHRDIAPDNIMILPDGSAKLLDFGAAREVENAQADQEMPKSTEAILKQGFAPIEQYSRRGSLGPWTDVYAMCATIYYCLTGTLPNPSPERIMGDDNVNWRGIPGLSEQQIQTLEQGMVLNPEHRLKSMDELYRGLFADRPATPRAAKPQEAPAPAPAKPKKKAGWKKLLGAAALAAVAAAVAAGLFLRKPQAEAPAISTPEMEAPVAAETTAPPETLDALTQQRYDEAAVLEAAGKKAEAAIAFGKLGDVLDARERSFALWAEVTDRKTIAAGCDYTAAVKKDGTVVFDGEVWRAEDWRGFEEWEDVIALSASINHLVGLKADGTVVAVGENQDGQCNVSDWKDIVAIACGESHTVGLKTDGTVVAVGNNIYYDQNIHRLDVERWEDIVSISADNFDTVGIRTDGTVIVAGYFNNWGQKEVIDWTDIASVSAGNWHVAGVKSDGTAVAGGDDTYQRCNVKNWTDLVAVSTGYFHTIGLKSDGTVVAVGRNTDNFAKPCGQCDVSGWKNVVDIDAGWYHSVALLSDGTVQVAGRNFSGNTWKEWTDILLPGEELRKEESQNAPGAYAEAESLEAAGEYGKAAIAFGKLGDYEDARARSLALWGKVTRRNTIAATDSHTVAVKDNGTVLATGDNKFGVCNVEKWTDIIAVDASGYYTVGLKSDGTAVFAGNAGEGESPDISQWNDLVAVSTDFFGRNILGLKMDGTVIASGSDSDHMQKVLEWKDIVSLCASDGITGLKADGTVVTTFTESWAGDVAKWSDIVAVASGNSHIVGLKSDGTVVAAGDNQYGQCDVGSWCDIVAIDANTTYLNIGTSGTVGVKADGTVVSAGTFIQAAWQDVSQFADVVDVSTSVAHTVVLKADGTAEAVGESAQGRCLVNGWKGIRLPVSWTAAPVKVVPVMTGNVLSPQWSEIVTHNTAYRPFESLSQVEYISFLDSLENAPEKHWDVSEAGDGSVLAWAERNKSNIYFHLYIAGEGGVDAPVNSSELFADRYAVMKVLQTISFNGAFYTGNVTNMSGMFYNCLARSLDVSSFDTGRVTDMKEMFCFCSNLTSLNLHNFDTSNVSDMCRMFWYCRIPSLDIRHFNTSNVTDMSGMFWNCWYLTDLELGEFDTSSVASYEKFMEAGKTVNGQPWEDLFIN